MAYNHGILQEHIALQSGTNIPPFFCMDYFRLVRLDNVTTEKFTAFCKLV